ncbi:hypothetical protein OEZ86_000773 [Tetradesmus obliquus]|nr:hypothetical protein OEZ86_000773 [Tetradesmus obliquus]
MSDAGWLMPWYFGVLYALQKLGIVTPGVTPIGGVSGGSVAAASSCLGLDFPSQVLPAVEAAAEQCRTTNLCAGNLHSVMDPTLKALLLPAASNAAALARCKANTQIYVSEGQPVISIQPASLLLMRAASVQIKGSRPQLIDKSNAEGFVDGIVANWFIPYYWSRFGAWSTTYRGQPAYEGYFTRPMPCPTNSKLCIRVSSRYPGPLCAKDKLYDFFVRPFYLTPNQPLYPQPADIHPGKYTKCKYTPMDLSARLSITPGSREDLQYLFDLGKADGAAWAADVGLTNPAACQAAAAAAALADAAAGAAAVPAAAPAAEGEQGDGAAGDAAAAPGTALGR